MTRCEMGDRDACFCEACDRRRAWDARTRGRTHAELAQIYRQEAEDHAAEARAHRQAAATSWRMAEEQAQLAAAERNS